MRSIYKYIYTLILLMIYTSTPLPVYANNMCSQTKENSTSIELINNGKTAWQGVITDRSRDTPVYQPTLLDEERTQKEGMWNNQWYQSKEKWQDAINDSVIGGFFRDTLLDDMNRPDAGWTLSEEHIKKASSLGDRTAAMWVLENSDSEQEFLARFFTKKEDLERRRRVNSMRWGLSSLTTFGGYVIGGPPLWTISKDARNNIK